MALTLSGEMLAAAGDGQSALDRFLLADAARPARREALLLAVQLLDRLGRHREVLALLAGDVRRPVPAADIMGVIPGAYDQLMQAEATRARRAVGRWGKPGRGRSRR